MLDSAAATRLCEACGLCCNGVLFHKVELQPGDSAPELTALGLRIRRKKKATYFEQPCVAFCGTRCAIYPARPARCRLFACAQLRRVAAGRITEESAQTTIRSTLVKIQALEALLVQAGATDPRRPLSKRYESAAAVPLTPASEPPERQRRTQLTRAMEELETILDQEFRVPRNLAPLPQLS